MNQTEDPSIGVTFADKEPSIRKETSFVGLDHFVALLRQKILDTLDEEFQRFNLRVEIKRGGGGYLTKEKTVVVQIDSVDIFEAVRIAVRQKLLVLPRYKRARDLFIGGINPAFDEMNARYLFFCQRHGIEVIRPDPGMLAVILEPFSSRKKIGEQVAVTDLTLDPQEVDFIAVVVPFLLEEFPNLIDFVVEQCWNKKGSHLPEVLDLPGTAFHELIHGEFAELRQLRFGSISDLNIEKHSVPELQLLSHLTWEPLSRGDIDPLQELKDRARALTLLFIKERTDPEELLALLFVRYWIYLEEIAVRIRESFHWIESTEEKDPMVFFLKSLQNSLFQPIYLSNADLLNPMILSAEDILFPDSLELLYERILMLYQPQAFLRYLLTLKASLEEQNHKDKLDQVILLFQKEMSTVA